MAGTVLLFVVATLVQSYDASCQVSASPASPPARSSPLSVLRLPTLDLPQTIRLKAEPAQPDWTKFCTTGSAIQSQACFLVRDFVSERALPLATLALQLTADDANRYRGAMRISLPHGLLLASGADLSIGAYPAFLASFTICLQAGCRLEVEINDDIVRALKITDTLMARSLNASSQPVTFEFPVEGFRSALDGPPISLSALQERNAIVAAAIKVRLEKAQ